MNQRILEAIRKSAAIPSMPQVVTRFLEVIQDKDFDYEDVVRVLSTDAGTVSEILRLANSAMFGLARKVTSLKQALTLLGPRRARSLVLGRFLVGAMGEGLRGLMDPSYFWRRSLTSAVMGARLAKAVYPRKREEIFLSALLADIGLIILARVFSQEYRPILECYGPRGTAITEEQERSAVGASHGEVSAVVMADWALPENMCLAVKLSHDDGVAATGEATQAARIINAGDRIARVLCQLPDEEVCVATVVPAMELVGLEPGVLVGMLDEVEGEIEELAGVLHIDVISSSVYARIAQAVQGTLSGAGAR